MNSTATRPAHYFFANGNININMIPYIPETFQILMDNQDKLDWKLLPYAPWSLPIWMMNHDNIVWYRVPEEEWAMPIWMANRHNINWDTCPCTRKWAQKFQNM